jgi:hypothetical protein
VDDRQPCLGFGDLRIDADLGRSATDEATQATLAFPVVMAGVAGVRVERQGSIRTGGRVLIRSGALGASTVRDVGWRHGCRPRSVRRWWPSGLRITGAGSAAASSPVPAVFDLVHVTTLPPAGSRSDHPIPRLILERRA